MQVAYVPHDTGTCTWHGYLRMGRRCSVNMLVCSGHTCKCVPCSASGTAGSNTNKKLTPSAHHKGVGWILHRPQGTHLKVRSHSRRGL
jgi:hypothetical protein